MSGELEQLTNEGFVANSPDLTGRVDKLLAKLLPDWTRGKIGRLIDAGGISINGKIVLKGSVKVKLGQKILGDMEIAHNVDAAYKENKSLSEFGVSGDESIVKPENIPLDIIYEDDDVLVVDKPVGMVVHPAAGNPSGTLANAVAGYLEGEGISVPHRVGLVHRLDKDVSGLMILAKNDNAVKILSDQFSSVGITSEHVDLTYKAFKFYWAVVGPTSALKLQEKGFNTWRKVEGYIRRKPSNRKLFEFSNEKPFANGDTGNYSLSYMRILKPLDNDQFLIEVMIITGRTHQIRVQLAGLGFSIVGDVIYGGTENNTTKGIRLRCEVLNFIPPRVYKDINGKPLVGIVKEDGDCEKTLPIKVKLIDGRKEVRKEVIP